MAEPLEVQLGEALNARGWRLGLAESCTGGLVGHRLTEVAGSSDYFLGGIISYSNRAKMRHLGVLKETLEAFGAVSEQTALQMAHGARQAFDSEAAASVTGIAGPGGGSEEKPVGLTFIAVVTPDDERVERYVFEGDRAVNKASAAEATLEMLLAAVKIQSSRMA